MKFGFSFKRLKTFWDKEKMPLTSIFFSLHNMPFLWIVQIHNIAVDDQQKMQIKVHVTNIFSFSHNDLKCSVLYFWIINYDDPYKYYKSFFLYVYYYKFVTLGLHFKN